METVDIHEWAHIICCCNLRIRTYKQSAIFPQFHELGSMVNQREWPNYASKWYPWNDKRWTDYFLKKRFISIPFAFMLFSIQYNNSVVRSRQPELNSCIFTYKIDNISCGKVSTRISIWISSNWFLIGNFENSSCTV